MSKVRITKIYDEIISYYRGMDYKKLIEKNTAQAGTVKVVTEYEREKVQNISQTEAEALFYCKEAYRTYTGDEKENDLEKIRRYLTDYFNHLMKYSLCINITKLKKGRTYCIDEKDAPIIKEILLRACSQHECDQIIGKWLHGKIRRNSYREIVELSGRLIELINSINSIPTDNDEEAEHWEAVKDQWITALKLALRSDLAYVMAEIIASVRGILSFTLPFKIDHPQMLQEKVKSDEQTDAIKDALLKEQSDKHENKLLIPVLSSLNLCEHDTSAIVTAQLNQQQIVLVGAASFLRVIPSAEIIAEPMRIINSIGLLHGVAAAGDLAIRRNPEQLPFCYGNHFVLWEPHRYLL